MADNPNQPLIDPSLLVRVKFKALQLDRKFALRPETLPDEAILPSLSAELAGEPKYAQVRMAVGTNLETNTCTRMFRVGTNLAY